MSAVGGLLVAGVMLPVVGGVGITARNAADKFQALSANLPSKLPQRSEILDSRGNVLTYFYGHVYGQSNQVVDRVPVSFDQIAPVMRSAIVAIEDSRFYEHGGIDVKGTVRAAIEDVHGGSVQGGSTIAQQYVKNVLILTAKNQAQAQMAASDTLARKIRELRYAVAVEHQMSKNQLLAAYLNVAYFGQQAYGVQIAAARYFSTDAAHLTLPQAALLAGIVENPAAYDAMTNPGAALTRRNTVLARMAELKVITPAQAAAAENTKIGLRPYTEPHGCAASYAAFFCDYVYQVINNDPAFHQAATLLDGIGGLKIRTTLSPTDQHAAQRAVDYMVPATSSAYNPGRNADTEVMIQPGTGKVRAIAIDRPYGMGRGQTVDNYAVGPQYDGGYGVQIGSTGKVYVMVTALLQGIPFGFSMSTPQSTTVSGYANCEGAPAGNGDAGPGSWTLHNDESEGGGTHTLYTGTTFSINTFFARLEQKVGLCETVRTASRMGLTWPDGVSLLKPDPKEGHPLSADNDPSFTLGADNVAPIDVAAADATLAARGIYCHPTPVTSITDRNGKQVPVESAGCHRALPASVADAANYILQGDLTSGTAVSDAIPGLPSASKTGTADNYTSAFFVGYTPDLLGAVWVGNPRGLIDMVGESSCYRLGCVGSMYGSMAPGKTWQMSFMDAALANPPRGFVAVPPDSLFFSKGNGQYVPPNPMPTPRPGGGNGGGNGGNGGGNGGNGGGNGGNGGGNGGNGGGRLPGG
jgi:membrane peptidoglycan carboxypeptidase